MGARPGILSIIAGAQTDICINIKSVDTSQTCISLLLKRSDLEAGRRALKSIFPKPFTQPKVVRPISLISIVSDGLLKKGIAANCLGHGKSV